MFWDASAIVPLLVDEPSSADVRAAAAGDGEMIVWWGTPIECQSAIARLEADELLALSDADAARLRLHRLMRSCNEVLAGDQLREMAGRLLRVHRLRAADALQLAAALAWARHRPRGFGMCTLDARLADAAAREGFDLVLRPGA